MEDPSHSGVSPVAHVRSCPSSISRRSSLCVPALRFLWGCESEGQGASCGGPDRCQRAVVVHCIDGDRSLLVGHIVGVVMVEFPPQPAAIKVPRATKARRKNRVVIRMLFPTG